METGSEVTHTNTIEYTHTFVGSFLANIRQQYRKRFPTDCFVQLRIIFQFIRVAHSLGRLLYRFIIRKESIDHITFTFHSLQIVVFVRSHFED